MNQWRLHVENFGKIAKATVDVSPFMIFVGKNNSGKSYLMVLLWGILTEAARLIEKHLEGHPDYLELHKRIKLGVEAALSGQQRELRIEADVQKNLMHMFNDILNANKEFLLERVFRFPVALGSLRVERDSFLPIHFEIRNKAGSVRLGTTDEGEEPEFFVFQMVLQDENILSGRHRIASLDRFITFILRNSLVQLVCRDFHKHAFFDDIPQSTQPLYLPASRTGFLHTYRAIVGNVFRSVSDLMVENVGDGESMPPMIQGAELNQPTIEFLLKLQQRGTNNRKQKMFEEEIRFLNEQIFLGRVISDENHQVRFIPRDMEEVLPLHVTSSLVAELAPISLFLESDYDPTLWIIEEAESHLHSEMQLALARFLFRLFNKGRSIWLTTHSDNFAQQINNLLTLSKHPLRAQLCVQLGYDERELLRDLSAIHAYQFETKDGITEVEQLELGKYGFEMKTFNNTLDRLVRETHLIQNYTGENNG